MLTSTSTTNSTSRCTKHQYKEDHATRRETKIPIAILISVPLACPFEEPQASLTGDKDTERGHKGHRHRSQGSERGVVVLASQEGNHPVFAHEQPCRPKVGAVSLSHARVVR